jgi:hypothetical protein
MKTCRAILNLTCYQKQQEGIMIKLQVNKHFQSLQVMSGTVGFQWVTAGLIDQELYM